MSFDPGYALNGFFYVYFTDPSGDIAIERFRVSPANPNLADPAPLSLLGKLLRIDVSNASAATPYSIPPTSPFVGQPNRRAEIWGYNTSRTGDGCFLLSPPPAAPHHHDCAYAHPAPGMARGARQT
jgi:hypothetical protein